MVCTGSSKDLVPPSKRRSRGGCQSCRLRRQKCDESKPSCLRCVSRGLKCTYKVSLSFRDEYEKNGKSFGREGVWTKQGTQGNGSSGPSNLMKKLQGVKFQEIRNVQALNFINYKLGVFNRTLRPSYRFPTIQIPESLLADLSDTAFALNYYLDFISPILNPVGFASRNSKLRLENAVVELEPGLDISDMIQYSQQHTHVFQMMLALGAMYLSKLDNSSYDWLSKSREFRREGLKSIETVFGANTGPEARYTTDQLLSLVLLMFYELAEDDNENWADYLHASGRLFFSPSFATPQSDVERTLLKFSLELLNYQETMGRTACKARSNFFISPDDDGSYLTPSEQTNDQLIHVSWMGCDKDLIFIISDITELTFERNSSISEQVYLTKCHSLRHKLDSMELSGLSAEMEEQLAGNGDMATFEPIKITVVDVGSNVEVVCYLLACEAKRIATVIYLECSLLNKTPKDAEIQSLVMRVYRILEFVVMQHSFKWFSTLLWTIFVASSEIAPEHVTSEELRYLTLSILKRIESRSLGNVAMTIDLVVGIWKNRDLAEGGVVKKTHNSLIGFKNDWDVYVADESYRVSLA